MLAIKAVLQEFNVDQINEAEKCLSLTNYYIMAMSLHNRLKTKYYELQNITNQSSKHVADTVYDQKIAAQALTIAAGASVTPSILLSTSSSISRGVMGLRKVEAEVHILKIALHDR